MCEARGCTYVVWGLGCVVGVKEVRVAFRPVLGVARESGWFSKCLGFENAGGSWGGVESIWGV